MFCSCLPPYLKLLARQLAKIFHLYLISVTTLIIHRLVLIIKLFLLSPDTTCKIFSSSNNFQLFQGKIIAQINETNDGFNWFQRGDFDLDAANTCRNILK